MCLLNGGEAACTAGYIDHHNVTCAAKTGGPYYRAHGSFYWPCPQVTPITLEFFKNNKNIGDVGISVLASNKR